MKTNKLKGLLIAACCVVSSLWAEVQGADEEKDQRGEPEAAAHYVPLDASDFEDFRFKDLAELGTIRIYEPSKLEVFENYFPTQNRFLKDKTRWEDGTRWDFKIEPNTVKYFDVNINEKHLKSFNRKQKEFKEKNINFTPVLAYHKTTTQGEKGIDNLLSILKNNFLKEKIRPSELIYGQGFYFTTKCVAGKEGWGNLYHDSYLVSLTLPGKVYNYDVSIKGTSTNCGCEEGYNSHFGDSKYYGHDELVIFEPSQILPIGIAHYSTQSADQFEKCNLALSSKMSEDEEVSITMIEQQFSLLNILSNSFSLGKKHILKFEEFTSLI